MQQHRTGGSSSTQGYRDQLMDVTWLPRHCCTSTWLGVICNTGIQGSADGCHVTACTMQQAQDWGVVCNRGIQGSADGDHVTKSDFNAFHAWYTRWVGLLWYQLTVPIDSSLDRSLNLSEESPVGRFPRREILADFPSHLLTDFPGYS